MSQQNSERRHHPRYSAPQLQVSLLSVPANAKDEHKALQALDTPIELAPLDFNHLGMSVKSVQQFNVGDVLHLQLSNQHQAPKEISCFVCNRAKVASGYRSGLHFIVNDAIDNDTMNNKTSEEHLKCATQQSLLAIEKMLM